MGLATRGPGAVALVRRKPLSGQAHRLGRLGRFPGQLDRTDVCTRKGHPRRAREAGAHSRLHRRIAGSAGASSANLVPSVR